jgi:hypothetical protein
MHKLIERLYKLADKMNVRVSVTMHSKSPFPPRQPRPGSTAAKPAGQRQPGED